MPSDHILRRRLKLERAYNRLGKRHNLYVTPAERRYMEKEYECPTEEQFLAARNEEELKLLEEDLDGFIAGLPAHIGLLALRAANSPLTQERPERRARGPLERKRRRSLYHEGLFNRRLRVFGFVAESAVDLEGLLQRRLYPARRIRWPEMRAEYNRRYPDDKVRPASLKRMYNRAKGEAEVRELWFTAHACRYLDLVERCRDLVQRAKKDVSWWREAQEEARALRGTRPRPRRFLVLDVSKDPPRLLPSLPFDPHGSRTIPIERAHRLPGVTRVLEERVRSWQAYYARLARASRPNKAARADRSRQLRKPGKSAVKKGPRAAPTAKAKATRSRPSRTSRTSRPRR